MRQIPQVAVLPAQALEEHKRLFEALSQWFGVTFVTGSLQSASDYDGLVHLAATSTEVAKWSRAGVRTVAYLCGPLTAIPEAEREVSFDDTASVDPAFRSTTLRDNALASHVELPMGHHDEAIARSGERALWIRQHESVPLDLVGVPVPELRASNYLVDRFHKDDWFSLLPLFTVLREISGWMRSSIRACVMFDDPNLHWKTYGYVRYEEIAAHAREHNYHVSFATVPMDGWYVHQPTAELFKRHSDRLSLLIHGNDHTFLELHRPRSMQEQRALAAQAMRRVADLERVSGVAVARVMAAPHGACSEPMANALLETGFHAASISRGSLMARNPGSVWPAAIGLRPAEFFGAGLPIIPRFNIQADIQSRVRFAAFLGQPIIPVGHHDDLRDGLGVLEGIARIVNSIATTQWIDVEAISESNYESRQSGDLLQVRLYSRQIRLRIPPEIRRLVVERPWLAPVRSEGMSVDNQEVQQTYDSYRGEPLDVVPGTDVTIVANPPVRLDPREADPFSTRFGAIVRRQLCEGRDRLRPAIDRIRGVVTRPKNQRVVSRSSTGARLGRT